MSEEVWERHCMKARDEITALRAKLVAVDKERNDLRDRVERLDVQLAGCGVAALGGTRDTASPADYGWSASYDDVLALRLKYDALSAAMETMKLSFRFATNDALRGAANRVYCSKCYDAVMAGLTKEGT